MSKVRSPNPVLLALRKLVVSGFVVGSFAAYVVHEREVNSAAGVEGDSAEVRLTADVPAAQPAAHSVISIKPRPAATQTPVQPTATAAQPGQYRDGTYTGQTIDVFYGLVQVEATVQNGQLASVRFLQYPDHRRTSQSINSYAMPYLTREAIQAQSAYINIISGATLTSEGFAQSLYTALYQAKL